MQPVILFGPCELVLELSVVGKNVQNLQQIAIGKYNIKLMSSEEGLYSLQQKISHHVKHCFWHSTGPDADPRTPHDQMARDACLS